MAAAKATGKARCGCHRGVIGVDLEVLEAIDMESSLAIAIIATMIASHLSKRNRRNNFNSRGELSKTTQLSPPSTISNRLNPVVVFSHGDRLDHGLLR